MRPEVYEVIRREVLPGLDEVYLTSSGEPFLAPISYRILDDALAGGKRVLVVTNGTILRPDYIEKLVRAPSQLRLSIDGTRPEVVEYVRKGVRYEKIIEFMEAVKAAMGRGRHPRFEFQLSYVVMRSTLDQMVDCIELAHRYGITTVGFGNFEIDDRTDPFALEETLIDKPEEVRPHWERAYRRGLELGVVVPHPTFPYEARGKESLAGPESVVAAEGIVAPAKNARIPQCPLPWWNVYIERDGNVLPCCAYRFPKDASFGNVLERPFRQIWNGPAYRELRRTVNTPDMPESCRRCTMAVRI
jgi:radical SAM protein with 4Fe4S-binding SPASM domain